MGDTLVTPAAAVHEWRNDYYGFYRSIRFEVHAKVSRDPITGAYKYYRKVLQSNGTFAESIDSFPITTLRRRSYYCDRSIIDPNGSLVRYTFNELEDFTVYVAPSSTPVKTGMFPPSAPYPIVVESLAIKLDRNCTPITPFTSLIRTTVKLNDSGYQLTKFPWMDFDYAWPPALFKDEK